MLDAETIKKQIKDVFGDVPFPSHCGMQAAIAMDDWISDPKILKEITDSNDIKGHWWEIPVKEFKYCSLGSCYFDAINNEYYLPAYMTIVLDDPCYKHYSTLIEWLKPHEYEEESNMYDHFCEQFSRITKDKKKVCVNVLKYIRERLDDSDHYIRREIDEILNHEFWKSEC